MHPLDAEQARVPRRRRPHRLAALWLLALDSGMRQGEILAWNGRTWTLKTVPLSVTKSVRTGDGRPASEGSEDQGEPPAHPPHAGDPGGPGRSQEANPRPARVFNAGPRPATAARPAT